MIQGGLPSELVSHTRCGLDVTVRSAGMHDLWYATGHRRQGTISSEVPGALHCLAWHLCRGLHRITPLLCHLLKEVVPDERSE